MRTVYLYNYDELAPEVKEKALNNARKQITASDEYNECLIDDLQFLFNENIKDKFVGIESLKISFSLNCCQGDGVSFVGEITQENIMELAKKVYDNHIPHKIKRIVPYIYAVQFERIDTFYTHKYTVTTNVIDNYNDDGTHSRFYDTCLQFEKDIDDYRAEFCKELESWGYEYSAEYENDENIIKYIELSNMEFTEAGEVA
jgi:hypothetical protein